MKKRGFTIMEVLIVVAIIGVLTAIALSALNTARAKSHVARAQEETRNIRLAIELLVDDTGQWPGHKGVETVEAGGGGNELWNLSIPAAGLIATDGNYPNWHGPYIGEMPPDPWGNPYFFDTDYDVDPSGDVQWAVVVGSFGPNGVGENIYDSDNVYQVLLTE